MSTGNRRSLDLYSRSIAVSALLPILWGIAAWFGGRVFLFVIFGSSDVKGFVWASLHWFLVAFFLLKMKKKYNRINWYQIKDLKTGKVSVDVWYSKGLAFVISITTVIYFLGAFFTFSKLSL